MANDIEIFISSADEDEDFLKELENHLDSLTGTYSITIWHRKKVIPGQEQQREIDKHLKAARIILLLVSSSYLGSKDYLCNYEVQRAMEYKKAGAAEVIPVLLRAVYWEDAPFGNLEPLPANRVPVRQWRDKDEAFQNIFLGIRKVVKDLVAPSQAASPSPAAATEKNSSQGTAMHHQPSIREDTEFDVFLCHNTVDKPDVKEIAKQLVAHGIRPWLDEWELRPGLPWQPPVEEQIRKIKSGAVFIGNQGIGPWQRQEVDAFIRRFVNNRIPQNQAPVIPVFLKTAPGGIQLPVFLEGFGWVDFRQQSPDPMEQLVWGITGNNPHRPSTSGNQSQQGQTPVSPPPVLMDTQRQRLIQKRDETQKLWNIRNEKVQRLKEALEIETDVNVIFKYEKQLAQLEVSLANLTKELEEIERALQ